MLGCRVWLGWWVRPGNIDIVLVLIGPCSSSAPIRILDRNVMLPLARAADRPGPVGHGDCNSLMALVAAIRASATVGQRVRAAIALEPVAIVDRRRASPCKAAGAPLSRCFCTMFSPEAGRVHCNATRCIFRITRVRD